MIKKKEKEEDKLFVSFLWIIADKKYAYILQKNLIVITEISQCIRFQSPLSI